MSSVLPLKWKIFSCPTVKDGENTLSCDMKDKIRTDFTARYESRLQEIVLNTATFLDPTFKDTFVTMEEEVKAILLQKSDKEAGLSSRAAARRRSRRCKKERHVQKSVDHQARKSEESVEACGAEGEDESFHIPC